MNNKKVEIKINNEAGDSAQFYGEEYDERFGVDSLTGKTVAKPFMETHGSRIFEDLMGAAQEKADDPEQIQREYDEMMKNQQNQQPTIDIMGLNQESQENDSQIHAVKEFSQQEIDFNKQIQKENEEYKFNLDKLTEKINEQEKILAEVTEKFNNCKDKDKKIKLFHEVNAEMNKLMEISSNWGQAVQASDTSSVVDSLSAYDNNYDEGTERKVIKEL
jgi:septal ring factor EnvC (AmiA/AmiB activator)